MVFAEHTEDTCAGRFRYDAAQARFADDFDPPKRREAHVVTAEEHGDLLVGIRNALFLSLLFWLPVALLITYWS